MPNWGQILAEVNESRRARQTGGPDLDGIRSKYIGLLKATSGRAVISYMSGWLEGNRQSVAYSVQGADVHGLMEVCYKVSERQLDLILHSPGGSLQAAEQMLEYLRTRFNYIRAIVPLQAKSAATIALGCDEILMGGHSELGPIDPQIVIPLSGGERFAPAHAILRDFERAKKECTEDINNLAAWNPILHSYSGGLIEFCHQQVNLLRKPVAQRQIRFLNGLGLRDHMTAFELMPDLFAIPNSRNWDLGYGDSRTMKICRI